MQVDSIKWIISQLEQAQIKPAKVLDLGSGTGRPVCAALVAAGHDVLGIDLSPSMLERARKQVPQAKFEHVDVRNFSAPSATFDAITVYWSMLTDFSQDDIRQSIRKIYDWLKPGGVFVYVTVPIVGNNVEFRWMGRPIIDSGFSREDTADLFRKVGFEIVHDGVSKNTPTKAIELGVCGPEDVPEEEYQVVYAKKPSL